MKRCVFCPVPLTSVNRSKEHVVPQWLQKAMRLTEESLSTGFADATAIDIQRRMGLRQFQAGRVCADCNNGWMSDLESETKDLLMGLIDQKINVKDLNCDECLTLGKWAVKTSIVCDSYIGEPPEIGEPFIRQFDKARSNVLGRCGVFVGRVGIASRFGYIRRLHRKELIFDESRQDIGIALCFDGLVLITYFVDRDLSYTFHLVEGQHKPIWPNRGHEFKERALLNFIGTGQDLITLIDAIEVRYRIPLNY